MKDVDGHSHIMYFIYSTRNEDYRLVQSDAMSQKILIVSTVKI
jgi:hypothetical protein